MIELTKEEMEFSKAHFTSTEQQCIEDKMRLLIGEEGKTKEQAFAIAINECAPAKVEKGREMKEELRNLIREVLKEGKIDESKTEEKPSEESAPKTKEPETGPTEAERKEVTDRLESSENNIKEINELCAEGVDVPDEVIDGALQFYEAAHAASENLKS